MDILYRDTLPNDNEGLRKETKIEKYSWHVTRKGIEREAFSFSGNYREFFLFSPWTRQVLR